MTNREFFHRLCSSEFPRFVRALEAVPSDGLDYRPHARSRSTRELVGHLIGHEQDLLELLETGEIHHRIQVPFTDMGEALRIYTDANAAVQPLLGSLPDDEWDRAGTFLVQGQLVMEAPRRELAWMLLLDAIHHRGQLSTYLRPMGAAVPSIYGPSADTVLATT
jgi:uncharacterized damage-inducible protein DinB